MQGAWRKAPGPVPGGSYDPPPGSDLPQALRTPSDYPRSLLSPFQGVEQFVDSPGCSTRTFTSQKVAEFLRRQGGGGMSVEDRPCGLGERIMHRWSLQRHGKECAAGGASAAGDP